MIIVVYEAKLRNNDWLRGVRLIRNLEGKTCNSVSSPKGSGNYKATSKCYMVN